MNKIDYSSNCQQCNSELSDEKAPFLLQCGHCLCQQCLDQAKSKEEHIICKICQEKNDPKVSLKNLQLLTSLNKNLYYLCSKHAQQKTEIVFKCYNDHQLCCPLCLEDHISHSNAVKGYISSELQDDLKILIKKLEDGQQQIQKSILNLQNILNKKIVYSKQIDEMVLEAEKILTKPLFSNLEFENVKFPLNLSHKFYNLQTQLLTNNDEKQFIKNLFDEQIQLTRIFSGTEDGFSSKSEHHQKFGGFINETCNPNRQNCWIEQHHTFLFSLTNKKKLPIVQNFSNAFYASYSYGPYFGNGADLCIANDCAKNNQSYSKLGGTYSLPQGIEFNTNEANNYLAGSSQFKILDYEVFQVEFL